MLWRVPAYSLPYVTQPNYEILHSVELLRSSCSSTTSGTGELNGAYYGILGVREFEVFGSGYHQPEVTCQGQGCLH